MSREEELVEFVAWSQRHISGDEKGQAQIFLDRLFQAFGHPGVLDVGGQVEFRLRRGADLQKHYRQAFDYGFNPKQDLLAQLFALNQQVAARIDRNEPVTPPGLPKDYPDPKHLVTDDCIHPPQP